MLEFDDRPDPLRTPRCEPEPDREGYAVRLSNANREFWIALDLPTGSRVEVATTRYSPSYGLILESRCIVATLPAATRSEAQTLLWSPPVEPDA